jgi:hypothetical protein
LGGREQRVAGRNAGCLRGPNACGDEQQCDHRRTVTVTSPHLGSTFSSCSVTVPTGKAMRRRI